ncbi:ECF transporter S component [Tepidibacter formicigenes]|jgi:energy-coupling factor transport system substrate-specific component|uniref:Energy-coupling factor transport system substrate-specific component n=1 Tax=Tepidibacter formicigenes DSM 15518 TaxID=1123349 RepID=A0A1M6QR74_9FIRM|nr:ECF transporter S component [Tepidibacter formicigenes]SHK22618.1 energy-coupling factor transport system substrate-specific component [Tepidibacter formicigenes DSM 15518]
MNYSLLSVGVLIFSFAAVFVSYERKKVSVKEISLIASMAALAGVGRVPFAALPNVQPTTFLVIISGYVFGSSFGFMVGAMATLVSNTFLGQGPWTPWQMISWGLAGASAGILKKFIKNPSRLFLSIFAFMWGFLFDYIMNIWHWLFFVKPLSIKSFIAVYISSFYFDLMHSLGNFTFMYLLGKDFINILSRFKDRISYSEIPVEKIK